MLISPPFLLAKTPNESDDDWIDRCMTGGTPGDGAYPVSFNLGWHGGMHLQAPMHGEQSEPVRAIADGKIVFLRKPTTQTPGPLQPDAALAYRGGWTHDGVLIIKHETEIGDGANGNVIFFSIYMHLSEIDSAIVKDRAVYRKARLGTAGQIYGDLSRKIHFEIICDDTNVTRLAGRNTGNLATTTNGRSDAVFGKIYYHIPSGAKIYRQAPLLHLVQASMQATPPRHDTPAPGPSALDPVFSSTADMVVGLQLATGNISAWSYQPDGSLISASAVVEADGEYNIYTKAKAISAAYPSTARPAPSAVYELIRFGRIIGPDALTPADVPNWRKIRYSATEEGWVNLNASGIHQFSDADMPQWAGWSLVDDSADGDSRCDSPAIKAMLDTDGDGIVKVAEAQARMALPDVAKKLSKTICKFPTEWDAATIDARWGWLKTQSEQHPEPITEEDFTRLKTHISALCFWPGNTGLGVNHWHWQPREFIRHFRLCGWLSQCETESVLSAAPVAGKIRAVSLREAMNQMTRKYTISTSRLRTAHLYAQVGHETGWWQFKEEIGNERYFRTMYEIITPKEAADDYRSKFAERLNLITHVGVGTSRRLETEAEYAVRRPGTVLTKATGMDNGANNSQAGGMAGDGSRFRGRGFLQITGRRNYKSYQNYRGSDFTTDPNPLLLATNNLNACDASGFYWSRENVNIEADKGAGAPHVARVGGIINRGNATLMPLHNVERQAAFTSIWKKLNDLL